MKKYYLSFISIYLVCVTGIVYIGRKSIPFCSYSEFNQLPFFYDDQFNLNVYSRYCDNLLFEEQDIDYTFENLYQFTDLIMLVESDNDSLIYPATNCNDCKVVKVFKGNYNKQRIIIHDLINFWNKNYVNYIGNLTPLKKNEIYLVFLKKAEYSTIKDSYVFCSKTAGHINISNSTSLVIGGTEINITVSEASNYDSIFTNVDEQEKFECLKNDIFSHFKL